MNPKRSSNIILGLLLLVGLLVILLTDPRRLADGPPERVDSPGRVDRETPSPRYINDLHGIEFRYSPDWKIEEVVERQDGTLITLVTLRRFDPLGREELLSLRGSPTDWKLFAPMIRTARFVQGTTEPVSIGEATGTRGIVQDIHQMYVTLERSGMRYEIMGVPASVNELLASLVWRPVVPLTELRVPFQRIGLDALPSALRSWAENCLHLDITAFHALKEFEGKTYLLVMSGRKPTGGYGVRVKELLQTSLDYLARVEFTRPPRDAIVTQAITRPVEIVSFDGPLLPVRFVLEGNDKPFRVTLLEGIQELRPIVAQSRAIKIFAPERNSPVGQTFEVAGVAFAFEGNVQYSLRDGRDQTIASGRTTAASGTDWGYFSFTIQLGSGVESGQELLLELFTLDEEAGQQANLITIPLQY